MMGGQVALAATSTAFCPARRHALPGSDDEQEPQKRQTTRSGNHSQPCYEAVEQARGVVSPLSLTRSWSLILNG